MRKKYVAPKAEKLEFDYTNVIVTSFDPADNPAGKGFPQPESCTSGHPSGKNHANVHQGCD